MSAEAPVVRLATAQLVAYNAADLDAFCACYHPDVVVLDGDGTVSARGGAAFRDRYAPMFAGGDFGATVDQRVATGPHCVEREQYWRGVDGERVTGEILVRYTERDGTIKTVQFLK